MKVALEIDIPDKKFNSVIKNAVENMMWDANEEEEKYSIKYYEYLTLRSVNRLIIDKLNQKDLLHLDKNTTSFVADKVKQILKDSDCEWVK
jgi:uncharacterized protein (UPF0248 family)